MDNQAKKPSGLFNLLTIVLCVLLVVSIVFNVVLYRDKSDLNEQVNTLTESNASLTAELDGITEIAATAEQNLESANQTIDRLTGEASDANAAASSLQADLDVLQAEYDTYQTDADAALAAAVQQGEDDIQAAQDAADETIASLQADLDALLAEYSAYQTDADAALAAAVLQGEDDVKAAQSAADETIASLQAELDAFKAETTAAESETEALEAATDMPQEETVAESETGQALASDAVVATVNGEDVTGEDVLASYQNIVNYYGEPDEASVDIYYAVAMDEAIMLKLIEIAGAQMGVDQFTDEELEELYATSDSEWQYALDNYVAYNLAETEDTTDEEREAAYAQAEAYYGEMGYSKDILRQNYVDNTIYERVTNELCKDVTVTDDEVLSYYDDMVQSDQEIYEFDLDAYETQLLMYMYGYADREPAYHPEGYRRVKNLLLSPDETLLATYLDLLARYEEQANAGDADEAASQDSSADTAIEDPVTAEDVETAKAAVIASVQEQIDEINARIAAGDSFDDIMAEYGVDTGMTSGEYPDGYEVSMSSYGFVPEFISAAFSVDAIGEISKPYVSEYGVHLVKYVGDVPGGPVALTDELKAAIHQDLLDEKKRCNLKRMVRYRRR